MPAILLTDIAVKKLKPTGKQFEIFDKKIKGLAVRVSPGGAKAFSLHYRYGRRNKRLPLGPYPVVSLKDARQRAQHALNEISKGLDPQAERTRERETDEVSLFSLVASEFIENHAKRNTRSWKETDRILRNEFIRRWGKLPLRQVSRRMINTALDEIVANSGPSAANHALAVIRTCFNWSVAKGHIDHSPCLGVKKPAKTVERDRVLSDPELVAIMLAAKNIGFPFGRHVELLISTLQRRSEVSGLRWCDLDLERATWTQSANSNKSGRTHIVPLSKLALETIRSLPRVHDDLVFPARGKDNPVSGYSKWKGKLDLLSGVKNWTLHDLRRTASTGMARLKVPLHVTELVLNHRSKSLSGIAGIYNRYEYLDDQRDALELWARHVEDLIWKANSAEAASPQNFPSKPVSPASAS